MIDLVWCVAVAVAIAGARAGYRWHQARRVPPLDPFWTDPK